MTRQFEDDKPHRRADDQDRSHDCAYESGGLRCRYPGAIGFGGLGGGPCYCRHHIRNNGSLYAQQALEQSQSWRAPPLIPEFDARTDPWFISNMPKLSNESEHDFAMRCKDWCLGKGFRLKPVVGMAPAPSQRMREPGEDVEEMEF